MTGTYAEVRGHPASVLYLDALCPSPLANLRGVQTTRRSMAAAMSWLKGAAASPAGGQHAELGNSDRRARLVDAANFPW